MAHQASLQTDYAKRRQRVFGWLFLRPERAGFEADSFMDFRNRQKQVLEQWQRFNNGEHVSEEIISPAIHRSWMRCRGFGVDPEKGNRSFLTQAELEKRLKKNALLVKVARAMMERLYEPISLSESIISISDSDGVILDCLRNTEKNYPIPNIEPGSVALETSSGTNAINLCLAEKQPVSTLGAEHYCSVLHNWFCSAAPLRSTGGEVIGVINVTLPLTMFHGHTQGMVETAAFAITEQLRLHQLLAEQKAIFEMMEEGIIIVNLNGAIQSINKKARDLLLLARDSPIAFLRDIIKSEDIAQRILLESEKMQDQEVLLQTNGGAVNCLISVSGTENQDSRILTLREVKKARETATRMVGAKAVFTFAHIVGESPTLRDAIALAQKAATSEAPALVLGESGTGKELFAQAMHNGSSRGKGPFITVNCGALPRELVQSELFGYSEGAFTGASRLGKPGKFELADNGTIFLDEIGEMPLDVQVSLLRLLQNGEVTRVGSKYTRHVNVRVIAATNRDLQKAMRQGIFREDLFWRLNVFTIQSPPLREREGDVPVLIKHFLAHFSRVLNRPNLDITDRAAKILSEYDWPGNVRELENMIERMAYLAADNGLIDLNSIPAHILDTWKYPETSSLIKQEGILNAREKESIYAVLIQCEGNMREAARRLGISRSGLYNKIKKFGIDQAKLRN